VRADFAGGRDLGEGEHSLVTEPLPTSGNAVRPDDVVDDEAVEGLAGAAGQAALVENAGDLAGGVLTEEVADGGRKALNSFARAEPHSGPGPFPTASPIPPSGRR